MFNKHVCVLSVDEAREGLVQFFADVLADRANMVDLLQAGELHESIPSLHELSPEKIADLYGELCVGDKFMDEHPEYDLMMVQIDDCRYEMVAIKG